jgi:hypothetical protein
VSACERELLALSACERELQEVEGSGQFPFPWFGLDQVLCSHAEVGRWGRVLGFGETEQVSIGWNGKLTPT